jgi:glutathionyl-hydroquinone reductase
VKENLDQISKIANDSDLAIRTHTILQQSAALSVFCLAIRHPSTADAMDKADAKLTPNIVKFETVLFQQFKSSRCQIDDPKGCFALTLRLRDASGFNEIVFLKNPATNEWE